MFYLVLRIILFDFVLRVHYAWGDTVNVPGEYPTIQEGIDAARSGDRVVVTAGRYNEQIVMREGIILRSDSSNGGDELVPGPGRKKVIRRALRTIIDGTGYPDFTKAVPMVEFPAGITRATVLDGFTVTKMPEVNHTLPGHAHTIQCRGSSPVVKNNIVIDNGSAGIGSHAQFKIDRGLSIAEKFSYENIAYHAYPLIENNVFARNIGAGIGNNHYSYATVRNNEVTASISTHNHPAPGIGIQHGAHPLVEGNLVYANDWTGIGCRRGTLPVNRRTCPIIRGNTVINNGLSGDIAHGAGIGADGAGSAGAPVTIENNMVGNNLAAGVGVRNGAFAVISGNRSYENDLAGIGVDKSFAWIKNNTVYHNTLSGIGCRGCQATIENNEIFANRMAGIGMDEAVNMVIVGNMVHNNGTPGFSIHPNSKLEPSGSKLFMKGDRELINFAEENSVRNFSHGIVYELVQHINNTKKLVSGTNEIFINRLIGKHMQNKPRWDNHSGAGVGMKKSRVLEFSGNILTNNAQPGLVLTDGSSIEKGEKNLFMENGVYQAPNIALLDRSRLSLSDTTIQQGNVANVILSDSYMELYSCRVERSLSQGIIAKKGAVLKINGGRISDNGALGVIFEGSEGDITNAVISDNNRHGIMARGKSTIKIENCTIYNNSIQGGTGVCVNSSFAHLIRNLIHHNTYVGVEVDNGTLLLWNNSLTDQMSGANLKGNALLDARNNIFANNYEEGVEMDETVRIKHLSRNVLWNNGGISGMESIFDFIFLLFGGEAGADRKKGNLEITGTNLKVNPGFVDPGAGDYCLRKGSPLIDMGVDLGLPFKGKAPDIGAIEVY